MKKIGAWLSEEEHVALVEYCKREGKSMYSVLREGINYILQGKCVSVKPMEPSVGSQRKGNQVAPPLPPIESSTVQVAASPKLEKLEERFTKEIREIRTEVDKITGNEQLWREVNELKAIVGKLEGQVGLLLKLEELEKKIDRKIEDTMVGILEKFGRLKERV